MVVVVVFVLCNCGTKQEEEELMKGIQLPDNYSGTDDDMIVD